MTVAKLIEQLNKLNPEATVRIEVEWAKDCVQSDADDELRIQKRTNEIWIVGWLSNCGARIV